MWPPSKATRAPVKCVHRARRRGARSSNDFVQVLISVGEVRFDAAAGQPHHLDESRASTCANRRRGVLVLCSCLQSHDNPEDACPSTIHTSPRTCHQLPRPLLGLPFLTGLPFLIRTAVAAGDLFTSKLSRWAFSVLQRRVSFVYYFQQAGNKHAPEGRQGWRVCKQARSYAGKR